MTKLEGSIKRRRTVSETPDAITQLPLWPEQIRGLPNAVAQSALFSVNCSDPRKRFHRHAIASQAGVQIVYTGEELRLDDEDVLLQLIHLARLQPLGEAVMFTSHSIIKALGWTINKRSYERLYDSIERMKATSVTIKFAEQDGAWAEYKESLIASAEHGGRDVNNRTDSLWRVRFHKRVIVLFGEAAYSHLDWQTRLRLPPLAKKLHSFYMSYEDPFGMQVQTLYTITGSRMKQLKQFRYKLREALDILKEHNFLTTYVIDPITDIVRVQRTSRPRSLENQAV